MIPAAVLGVLQVFDIWSTLRILKAGGRELNPVLRYLMLRVGPERALVALKVILMGVVLLTYERLPTGLLWLLVGVYSVVLGWNLNELRKGGQNGRH